MDWFYADGKDRRGPVPENEFRTLISAGTVKPETLVWRQGMTQWVSLRDSLFDASAPDLAAGMQRCFITGKTFPTSQMLQTEHGWVSADARDTYYQCLRESVPFPVPDGVSNARSDGKRIIVPAGNPVLPRRCIKTNQPVTDEDVKRKKLYWASPWLALTILLSLLIYIIAYLIVRKLFIIDIPLSRDGRRIVRNNALIAWGIALGGIALIIVAAAEPKVIVLLPVGIVAILAAMLFGFWKAGTLRLVKLNSQEAWLKGASPEYLASLPRV